MSTPDSTPVGLRIRLPYASEEEFLERYGGNVARGGIFIATRAVKPEGTLLQFELVLADGTRLMRGEGTVVKAQPEAPGVRTGMTVRFSRLDAKSKALVDAALARRAPGTPPPPEEPAPVATRAPRAPGVDLVLGVDLGTSWTRAALFVDGAPHIIPLAGAEGSGLPSVVAIDEGGQVLVGSRARARLVSDPRGTAFAFLRLLGLRADSARTHELAQRRPWKVVADDAGDAAAELHGKTWRLSELAAELLRSVQRAAEQWAGQPVKRAVLCVPGTFDAHQRAALREAGMLAGLEVLRIVNATSAGALAFGYGRGLARKRVLVCDFGGGTFDASVVELTGDDLDVVASGGDPALGGLELDARIAEALQRTLATQAQATATEQGLLRMREAAEAAKRALSDADTTPVHVPFAGTTGDGASVDLRTELTRDVVEQLTSELVDRTVEISRSVLAAANLSAQNLDEVLLIGGQTRAPQVHRKLEEALGRPARTDVDPEAAVALGAALLGHAVLRQAEGKTFAKVSELLTQPIGIALRDGSMRRVLERSTRLPAEKSLTLPMGVPGPLTVAVFQGDSARAEENAFIGAAHVDFDKPGDAAVRFSVASDGTLGVTVRGGRTDARLEAAQRPDLLAHAPEPEAPETSGGKGVFGGLKRLFGRR